MENPKKITLALEMPRDSENIQRLFNAVTHLLDIAGAESDDNPLTSEDTFCLSQLLRAIMAESWNAEDRADPIILKPQPEIRAS